MPDSRRSPIETPEECANCGASLPRGAKACPECGADERSGWRETDAADGLNLPDEAYADEVRPTARPRKRVNGLAWYWWALALLLLGGIALAPFFRR